jgi:hypothetical protein
MEGSAKVDAAEDCSGSEKPGAFAKTLVRLLLAGLPSLLLRADLGMRHRMRHRSYLRGGLWLCHYHGCCHRCLAVSTPAGVATQWHGSPSSR